MQQLEGFRYVKALDIKMIYCTIRISTANQGMMTIVTEFGNFRDNCLPMGMCALGYIIQSKVYRIREDSEGVKMYTNDILVLHKYSFKNTFNR